MKTPISFIVFMFLLSCSSSKEYVLDTDTSWYWQLQVNKNHPLRMDIPAKFYDIDLFETPTETIKALKDEGKIVICYFSAGTFEPNRPDAYKFPKHSIGVKLQSWNENWLNINDSAVRQIMKERIKLAKEKGCDGIEPDNVDGFTHNTGFNLTYEDQLEYNKFLATTAHKEGLIIGLKNDLRQVKDLVNYFDFAINEQCFKYNECYLLKPFVDNSKPVLNAEYEKKYINNDEEFAKLCENAKKLKFNTNVFPVSLDGSFVKSCDYGEYN